MALVKCKECGSQISTKAAACPQCGAKMEQPGFLAGLFKVFLILFLIVAVMAYCQDQTARNGGSSASLSSDAGIPPAPALPPSPPTWVYETRADSMTGKEVHFATIDSANQVEFEFPYQGVQRATLVLRKHPRFGRDVYIKLQRAQFNCSYDGCSVMVRFNEGAPQKFSATEPESNDSDTLFISNYDRFAAGAIKAQTIRIEASFYQQGNRAFEFDAGGLQWPPGVKPKAP